MAIELLKGPDATAKGSVGRFDLPHDFDSKKYAAEWVPEKDVEAKRGRERLLGVPATADGWEVYKGPKNDQKLTKATVKEGTFVLMVRPRDVQDAVNVLYGNLGKQNARYEQEGETVAGAGVSDRGMLSDRRMRGLGLVGDAEERNEAQFAQTPLPHIGGSHVDNTKTT